MTPEQIQFASLLITFSTAITAITTLYRAKRKSDDESASRNANAQLTMQYMQRSIDDVSRKQDKLIEGMNISERRLSIVETVLKEVVKRVDVLERKENDRQGN